MQNITEYLNKLVKIQHKLVESQIDRLNIFLNISITLFSSISAGLIFLSFNTEIDSIGKYQKIFLLLSIILALLNVFIAFLLKFVIFLVETEKLKDISSKISGLSANEEAVIEVQGTYANLGRTTKFIMSFAYLSLFTGFAQLFSLFLLGLSRIY
ncbi:hypothetical protein GF389_01080 [Candidatus Dojkabacteria bacterium]|nr:hypothetical protein [Candidatus Dojkabacteria bacterium]